MSEIRQDLKGLFNDGTAGVTVWKGDKADATSIFI
jgi:hypothetical protein